MSELQHFRNSGFGWVCKKCESESKKDDASPTSRLMHEGEAESKSPILSTRALAQWTDKTRQTLVCRQCGITEDMQ